MDEQPPSDTPAQDEVTGAFQRSRRGDVEGDEAKRGGPGRSLVDVAAGDEQREVHHEHDIVYDEHRTAGPVDQTSIESTQEQTVRRIVHFADWRETRWGAIRFSHVVTIVPASQMWVGLTILPGTKQWSIVAEYSAAADPYQELSDRDEYVVDTYLRRPLRRSWLKMWRCCYGFRAPPKHKDVWLCKQLLNLDIPRVKRPHDMHEWLTDRQPKHRARSKGQAIARGGRAIIGDLVAP